MPGFDPVMLTYDHRGRLSTTAQGSGAETRTATVTYNAQDYPKTITDTLQRTSGFTHDAACCVPRPRASSETPDIPLQLLRKRACRQRMRLPSVTLSRSFC